MENSFDLQFDLPELPEVKFDSETEEETAETVTEDVAEEESEEIVDGDPDAIAAFETFKKLGVVEDEDFDGTFDSIQTALENREAKRSQEVAQSFVEQAPEVLRNLLKYAFAEYDATNSVDIKKMQEMFDAFKEDMGQEVISDEEDARTYLEKLYSERGMKKAAVNAQLDALEDDGELLTEAKKEVEKNSAKKQEQLLEKQRSEREKVQREQEQFMGSIEKQIVDTGWKPERVKIVKHTLAKSSEIMAQVSQSPAAIVQFADFLSTYKDGKFNIEAYVKQAASKDIAKIKDNIVASSFRQQTSSKREAARNSIEDLVPVI